MTLQSAISAELPFLRAEAEARMLSTATIRRRTGQMVESPNGLEVPEWTIVATSRCRIGGANSGSSGTRTVDIAGAEVQIALRTAHLPVGTDVRDGDYLDVTGEAAGVWRVVESAGADQQTALRVPVVAADRPEEWA